MLKKVIESTETKEICDKLIWSLTVMLIPLFGLFDNHSLVSILMYAVTGLTGCLILIKENINFRFRFRLYYVYILIFVGVCFASTIWAWDKEQAFIVAGYICRNYLCMSVFYYHYEQKKSTESLLQAIKWGGYVLALVALIGYNPKNIIDILLKGGRLYTGFVCFINGKVVPGFFSGIFTTNINLLGHLIAIPVVIGLYDLICEKKINLYEVLGIFPALLFVVLSGGKKIFLIVLLGLLLILMVKTKHESMKKTIFRWCFLLMVILIALYGASFLPAFREIYNRFYHMLGSLLGKVYEVSTNERIEMIQVGLAQFMKTPIGGIGVDNARFLLLRETGQETYLHCNYIELLTGMGILGTIVYYIGYFYPLINFWKYRRFTDHETRKCLILICVSLFADIASVTYTLRITGLFLGLYFIQVKKLRESQTIEKQTEEMNVRTS